MTQKDVQTIRYEQASAKLRDAIDRAKKSGFDVSIHQDGTATASNEETRVTRLYNPDGSTAAKIAPGVSMF